ESFDHEDWLFEIKWDGYRIITEIINGEVELYSRKRKSLNAKYSSVVEALKKQFPEIDLILDGEIVVLNERGRADFQKLQSYPQSGGHLILYAFDLLFYKGWDLRQATLIDRKMVLKSMLQSKGRIRYVDHIEAQGRSFFYHALQQGLEGIMAKEKFSLYKEGYRSKQWQKIKAQHRQEVVIGGYTEPRKSRKHLGALVMGVYEKDQLIYVGHTGAGQSAAD